MPTLSPLIGKLLPKERDYILSYLYSLLTNTKKKLDKQLLNYSSHLTLFQSSTVNLKLFVKVELI